MGKWYLVRHGRTSWNLLGRMQGQTDVPLEAIGLAEARQLGKRLSKTRFGTAYSSDLQRAVVTAQTILQGRTTPLCLEEELRECRLGEWEGLTYQQIGSEYPDVYEVWVKNALNFAPPGGESPRDLLARTAAFGRRVIPEHLEDDLLIVGHGASLRALAVGLLGLPEASFWQLRIEPASLSIIRTMGDTAVLDLWNDTSHLEASGE